MGEEVSSNSRPLFYRRNRLTMQTLNLWLPAMLCDGPEYQVSGYMYCPNLDSPTAGKVTPAFPGDLIIRAYGVIQGPH